MNNKDSGETKHVELMLDKFNESKEILAPINMTVDSPVNANRQTTNMVGAEETKDSQILMSMVEALGSK